MPQTTQEKTPLNFKMLDKDLFPKLQSSGLVGEKVGLYGSGGRPLHPHSLEAYKRELPQVGNHHLLKKNNEAFFGGESVQ
jgi:hypothetical protein